MSNSTKISGVNGMRNFIRRIYFLGLVFVIVGALSTFAGIRHLEEQLQQHVEQTISFKLDHVMGEVSLNLLHVERMLDAVAIVLDLETDDARITQFFNQVLADNDSFLAMFVGRPDGHVLYANDDFPWVPSDPRIRPWYQAAAREEKLVFTPPYVDAAMDRWVMTMAKPIYDEDGRLLGVIGIDESLKGMLAVLDQARPSKHGHAFALDGHGQLLLNGPMDNGDHAGFLGDELTARVLSEPEGIIFTSVDGQDGYLRWQMVGSSEIVLGLFAPITDFLDYRVLVIQVLATTALSFAALTLVLLVFQRRYITRPMAELDRDIMAIALDQDVTYRLPARKNSPFEMLRLTINRSLDRVQEHFESIIQHQEELAAAYGQLVAHEKQLQEQYSEIRADEEHILFLADHDILTGLSNRRKFDEDMNKLLDAGQTGSVLLLDIDNFKDINDTLGHVYGDAVLQHLAGVLKKELDTGSTVYRFGGDEFLIVVRDVVEPEELKHITNGLLQSVGQMHNVEGRQNHLTSSVGVVRFPYDGTSTDQLLVKVDLALHRAKSKGRNRYVLFEASMSASFAEQVHMQHILREAVQTGGFRLLYQPIVEAATGEVAYLEALIRLRGHDLSPAVFIPAAEESDLIQSIGRWVITEAIGQLVAWREAERDLKPISINLSPKQFYDEGLVDFLADELRRHNVDPSLIEMEITETVLIDSAPRAVRIIDSLRKLGIRVALDDFGTGYLSIKYIVDLRVDHIKLDRSMIQGLPEVLPVVQGLITIAHGLGMDVVAEGIEQVEEARHFVQARCDYLQGFLFSRPVSADEAELMLEANFADLIS